MCTIKSVLWPRKFKTRGILKGGTPLRYQNNPNVVRGILVTVFYSLFAISCSLSVPCVVQAQEISAGTPHAEEQVSINFDKVSIRMFIQFVSKVSGKNFLIDDRVKGVVTVITSYEIPVDEVYGVFLHVMRNKGFGIVPSGAFIKIVPLGQRKQFPLEVAKGVEEIPEEDKLITQLITPQYMESKSLQSLISPFVSPYGHLTLYDPTNTLVLTDVSSNVRRLLEIVDNFDVEGTELQTTLIPLKYASATTLAQQVNQVIGAIGKEFITRRGAKAVQPVQQRIMVLPYEQTNSLVLVATKTDTDKIKELIEKLDQPSPPGSATVHIYYLKNASAEELSKILSSLSLEEVKGVKEARGAQGAKAPMDKIAADKATNSLIITAAPEEYHQIKSVIEKLDIVRPQVLVQALIADVSMSKMQELGIEWATLDQPVEEELRGFAGTRFGGQVSLYERGLSLPGLIMGIMRGSTEGIPNVGAIIQLYKNQSGFNILATPHLLTMDNEEAKITVGSNIPYISSYRITEQDSVVRSYEYKDVGVELTMTPHIGMQDLVRLEIHQKVTRPVPSVGEAPTTTVREAQTTVSVRDKATIVIGGLIQDDKTEVIHKVPLLGDIPLLGLLFQRKEDTVERRNLLIFITPTIVRTREEIAEVVEKKRAEQEKFKLELPPNLQPR